MKLMANLIKTRSTEFPYYFVFSDDYKFINDVFTNMAGISVVSNGEFSNI